MLSTRLKAPYALAAFGYCGLIFFLSHQPEFPESEWVGLIPFSDKIVHVIIYGGLAATLSIGIRRSNEGADPRMQFYAPIGFAALYGITDEVHQIFVPNRTFELLDLAADGLGALLAQMVLCIGIWRLGRLRHVREG